MNMINKRGEINMFKFRHKWERKCRNCLKNVKSAALSLDHFNIEVTAVDVCSTRTVLSMH